MDFPNYFNVLEQSYATIENRVLWSRNHFIEFIQDLWFHWTYDTQFPKYNRIGNTQYVYSPDGDYYCIPSSFFCSWFEHHYPDILQSIEVPLNTFWQKRLDTFVEPLNQHFFYLRNSHRHLNPTQRKIEYFFKECDLVMPELSLRNFFHYKGFRKYLPFHIPSWNMNYTRIESFPSAPLVVPESLQISIQYVFLRNNHEYLQTFLRTIWTLVKANERTWYERAGKNTYYRSSIPSRYHLVDTEELHHCMKIIFPNLFTETWNITTPEEEALALNDLFRKSVMTFPKLGYMREYQFLEDDRTMYVFDMYRLSEQLDGIPFPKALSGTKNPSWTKSNVKERFEVWWPQFYENLVDKTTQTFFSNEELYSAAIQGQFDVDPSVRSVGFHFQEPEKWMKSKQVMNVFMYRRIRNRGRLVQPVALHSFYLRNESI